MDYMYNFMSEGAITTFVNHIYYTGLDRLKSCVDEITKHYAPGGVTDYEEGDEE